MLAQVVTLGRRAYSVAAIVALVAIACSLPGPPSGGSQPDLAITDSIVGAWVADGHVPGAVLHLEFGDGASFTRAYGFAHQYEFGRGQYTPDLDPEHPAARLERLPTPVPMTTETVFDVASVTKVAATTLAVMILTDRGVLDPSEAVGAYLEDFTAGGRGAITVEHLLSHRSGLAPWWPIYYHADDADDAYAFVRDHELVGVPGEERRYSDLGFMVLGRIVEAVSGQTLDRFLDRELYGPLGLGATGFRPYDPGLTPTEAPTAGFPRSTFAATSHGNPFERRMVHDLGFGYRIDLDPTSWNDWRQRTLVGEVNDGNAYHAFRGVAGHAGLFSTAAELATLMRLVMEGGVTDNGRRFFGSATATRFLADSGDGQALGWQLPEYAPRGSFGHTGFTGTLALAIPREDVVLVLLTNRQHGGVGRDGRYPDLGEWQREVVASVILGIRASEHGPGL